MDQIIGIIALVSCAGIFIYQYVVRRKRDGFVVRDIKTHDIGDYLRYHTEIWNELDRKKWE